MKQIIKINTNTNKYNVIVEDKSILHSIIREAKQGEKILERLIIERNLCKYLI